MKIQSPAVLWKRVLPLAALSGWCFGLGVLFAYLGARQEARDLEQLNSYLLADVQVLKSHSGTGVADRRDKVISDLRTENKTLQIKLDGLHGTFQKQLKDVVDAKWNPEGAKTAGRPAVDLGTLAVTDRGAVYAQPSSSSSSKGRIVSVDEKDEFVVINLGKKAGVSVGSEFRAKQEKGEIAKLHVIEVRDSIAACNIEYLLPGGRLQINDEVYLAVN